MKAVAKAIKWGRIHWKRAAQWQPGVDKSARQSKGSRFMLIIRTEQMKAFEEVGREGLINQITLQLRQKLPGKLPGSEESQRGSVAAWIEDARRWGLRSPELIARYVEACAATQREHLPFGTRLKTYLALYHENRVANRDVADYVTRVVRLAQRYQIATEEAITGLAVFLLDQEWENGKQVWIHEVLGYPGLTEEARLRLLYTEAMKRGEAATAGGSA